jgi:hypothetical protein
MGQMRNADSISEILKGKDHLGNEDGMIILKRIFKGYDIRMWTGFICLWIGSSGVLF